QHAVLLPLADLAGAQPRREQVRRRLEDPDPRCRVQARHRRHARDAGREAHPPAAQCRRRRFLPRPARGGLRRDDLVRTRARALRLHRHRDQPLRNRLRRCRPPRQGDRRLSQRHEGARGRRQGLEAVTKVAVVGLGYWGPNLVRNFDELTELVWLVDLDPQSRERFATRYPNAKVTDDLEEVLADESVDAVVVATPVPTHYALAKRALERGKHVMVEKPPAMRAAEMDELVALAADNDRVLMPGHLLLYHPGG